MGTLMYLAPEALSGEVVTPAADQYSLACIAYLLLTGTLPYAAKSPREMFSQLLTQPPKAINKARQGLVFNASVEAVVMRGLAKDPKDRYLSVVEFARALAAALLTGHEPPADNPGMLSRMKGLFKARS